MSVPSTVNSLREQIREAVKLSIATLGGSSVSTMVPYTSYPASTSYPLCKAYYDGSTSVSSKYMGTVDVDSEVIFVEVTPWCTSEDFELETSKIIESARPKINTDSVRALMYSAYQDGLVDISVASVKTSSTMMSNPYATVIFSATVKYRQQS